MPSASAVVVAAAVTVKGIDPVAVPTLAVSVRITSRKVPPPGGTETCGSENAAVTPTGNPPMPIRNVSVSLPVFVTRTRFTAVGPCPAVAVCGDSSTTAPCACGCGVARSGGPLNTRVASTDPCVPPAVVVNAVPRPPPGKPDVSAFWNPVPVSTCNQ